MRAKFIIIIAYQVAIYCSIKLIRMALYIINEFLCLFSFFSSFCLFTFSPINFLDWNVKPLELCDLNCGSHGRCVGESCACESGWGGEFCNTKSCDARCNEHGQCKNGTCLCVTGWNGKHCTIEGCPSSCSNHGQCRVNGDGNWECRCYDGWDGVDCSVALEQNCADNKDNDKGILMKFLTLFYPQQTQKPLYTTVHCTLYIDQYFYNVQRTKLNLI